jgi:hypothetical protein
MAINPDICNWIYIFLYPEPEFVNLLRSPGIDSHPDRIDSLASSKF